MGAVQLAGQPFSKDRLAERLTKYQKIAGLDPAERTPLFLQIVESKEASDFRQFFYTGFFYSSYYTNARQRP